MISRICQLNNELEDSIFLFGARQTGKSTALRQQYPKLDGGAFFSIDCIENYELIRELTSFGKDLIVLSPQNIVEQVQQRIIEMHNEYSAVFKID